jgi:hypothetical protein
LEWLNDFDWRSYGVQTQSLPEQIDFINVHPSKGTAAKIKRDSIRFLMS